MTITKQQLVAVLTELPAKLHEAEASLWQATQEKIKIAKRMEIRKAQLAIDVVFEESENGKRKYPNEEARSRALELRLADDEHYSSLADEWEKACVHEEQARCDFNYQKYRLKVAELLTQLLTADGERDENRKVSQDSRELGSRYRPQDRQARQSSDWR